jgi:hypothetical protein
MKVIDIKLNKDKLLQLPELERTLYLALGHEANEINALAKMLYWASNAPARNSAEERGRFALELLFMRLLAGKLNESWELLGQKYFGPALSKTYDPKLDDRAREAFNALRFYFGRENACNKIRNQFAFHYSPEEVAAMLPGMTDELHIYLERDAAPNNLFAFSEALLAEALLEMLRQLRASASLDDLVTELFDVAAWFAQVADALMFTIADASSLDLRLEQPVDVVFDGLPDLQSVAISWFSDTSKAVKSQPGSA